MLENNIIKSIVQQTCPHCHNLFFLESIFQPTTGEIFTKEMMDEAKKDCISRVETLSLDDDKKESVIKWLKNEKTIFAPQEVDSIILSLVNPPKIDE